MKITELIQERDKLNLEIESHIWNILHVMSVYSDDDLMSIVNDTAAFLDYYLMGADKADSMYVTATSEDRYDDLSLVEGYRIPLEYFQMDDETLHMSTQQMFMEEEERERERQLKSLKEQAEFYGFQLVKKEI